MALAELHLGPRAGPTLRTSGSSLWFGASLLASALFGQYGPIRLPALFTLCLFSTVTANAGQAGIYLAQTADTVNYLSFNPQGVGLFLHPRVYWPLVVTGPEDSLLLGATPNADAGAPGYVNFSGSTFTLYIQLVSQAFDASNVVSGPAGVGATF